MFTYLVQTINNMYQNVSGKSIENQELILRVFLLCTFPVLLLIQSATLLYMNKLNPSQAMPYLPSVTPPIGSAHVTDT